MTRKYVSPILLLSLLSALLLSGCGAKTPEKLVESELNLIKKLDEKTIQNFVSYEDISQTQSRSTDIGSETTEAVQLFFQNFDYEILSSGITDDSATVTVSITNLDAKSLAHDLHLALVKESVDPHSSYQEPMTMNSYFTILRDILKNNTYEETTTQAHFELAHLDNGWSIQITQTLEDELVGGLITYLSDPYLLTPNEVATATLDVFTAFSPKDWVGYLDMHDVFAIGSQYSDKVDLSLATQIAKHFSYSISQMKVDGDKATAYADITSLDMSSVLASYKEKLLAYADTTASVRASDSELADQSATFLKEALDENQDTILRSVLLLFQNNGSSWEMTLGDDFGDVILGGSSAALSSFSQ